MNGQVSRHLISHELGHFYGVVEEGPAWVCMPRCHGEPYGNPFSVMGHGLVDFGAWEKLEFGWIGRDRVAVAERPGSFRLGAIDRPSSDPYALRVIVSGDQYWLEYRPPAPLWACGSNGLGDGGRFPGRNYVIADPVRRGRPSVQTGETFAVPDAFAVTVTSATTDGAEVRFRWTDRIRPAAPRLLRPVQRVAGWWSGGDAEPSAGAASPRCSRCVPSRTAAGWR
jgi:hypothetical protein